MAINKYRIPKFTSIFQPTTTVFENNITFEEFLTGILCRLNEVIDLVNQHQEFIENYSGKIEEIETKVNQLYTDFNEYKIQLNQEIDQRFITIQTQLTEQIASATSYMRAYTDARAQELQQQIDNIAIGEINVYDPSTGMIVPLQTALDNLFDSSREGAITASEYDALNMDASTYDGLEITATEYDRNGKAILTA